MINSKEAQSIINLRTRQITYHMKSKIIKNDVVYNYIGQSEPFQYDTELILPTKSCDDIWDKTLFVYALWEKFVDADQSHFPQLPAKLVLDLKRFFAKYDEPDMAYWNFIAYETIDEYSNSEFDICLNRDATAFEVFNDKIRVIVPLDHDYLYAIDDNGDGYYVEDDNYLRCKKVFFEMDSDCPWMFMSDAQIADGNKSLDEFLNKVIGIFKMNGVEIKDCHELAERVFLDTDLID